MIEPLFFKNDLLFGCYHPAVDLNSQRLLIVAPPFFDEYRRSYKALSDLAGACAEQGVHALRFDYYGTGESQGLLNQASVDGWIDDIMAAIEEGTALSGAAEIILLGVRFGATLAAQIHHPKIIRYIFWDPLVSGAAYIKWLDEVNDLLRQQHWQHSRYARIPFENILYENFHLPAELKNGMKQLVFSQKDIGQGKESHVITTSHSVFDSKVYTNCEFPGLHYDWPAYHDGIFLPMPVLEGLARRVLSR